MTRAKWLDPPFLPGQRVLVLGDDPQSGATLGHYGTIIRILGRLKSGFPDDPEFWSYRVWVPILNRRLNVHAGQLLALGSQDREDLIKELQGKIIFDAPLSQDNREISGCYQLPAHGIPYYRFQKRDIPVAIYQLEMQNHLHQPESTLTYDVPEHVNLDAEYVIRAVREVLGIAKPADPEPMI